MIACFPVYRSYITPAGPSDRDAELITFACEEAAKHSPDLSSSAFGFIRKVLLQQWPADREQMLCFAGKFQQLTSPVTAKGVEDTAFYRYNRLLSLNEVGGEPATFGTPPVQVHRYFSQRQRLWPCAMNTLSTHDTKRSEDVRARLNVLSEIPDEWSCHVTTWMALCRESGAEADDAYLLFQAMIGIWPLSDGEEKTLADRLKAYMTKAPREGKLRSSWTRPAEAYEAKVASLVDTLMNSASGAPTSSPFSGGSRDWAPSTHSPRPCSNSLHQAFPTPTRAQSFGTSHSSIRTTADR